MADEINPSIALKVLTPDKKVLETRITAMRILLPDGWWGILHGHVPMISYFDSGVVHYNIGKEKRYIALYQGTIEVKREYHQDTQVLILTAAAEEGDDLKTVQADLEQQAVKLAASAKEANREFNRMRLALERSIQEADISGIGV
ncbi:MAG: FoF1 ATP synthase subunit delta/epsilon [Anaerolineales bacterium]